MISGASQADVALLMVPANKGGFETSIAKGNHKKGEIQGQTRQHARLCHLLGIEQLIVGINKMDQESVKYSEDRYNEIKTEVEKMLTKIGYKTKKIPFLPLSGWKGDNLTKPSENMKWYKGFKVKAKKDTIEGHTLLDALEKVVKPPKRQLKKPFRMPVSGVYKIKGVGDVITGRIE
jgi:elongation factor 1-alpha